MNQSVVEWKADYRFPPPIDAMVWVPGYTVTRRGTLAIPGTYGARLVADRGADDLAPMTPHQFVSLQRCALHLNFVSPYPSRIEAAPGLVRIRARSAPGDRSQTAIAVIDEQGDEIASTELPVEVAYHSPERWGWLLASPVVDVFVLPANVLLFGALLVAAAVS